MRLPVDTVLPELLDHLRRHRSVVLEAPPGSGKTTRVPPALLDAVRGEILVLEPRRIAARLAAARVSHELGERPGQTVGYQIRFESVCSAATRIRYLTEGILLRSLVSDPTLARAGAVILDEFHERSSPSDLALGWIRRLQKGARPDLKLVVMSATLETPRLRAYLGDAPLVRCSTAMYPVAATYLERADTRALETQVAGAVKRVLTTSDPGDMLVFLPGATEIARAHSALGEWAQNRDLEVHRLHGGLSADEQDAALRPGKRQKVILATNLAESSITIEGVSTVIDSGLARIPGFHAWSGIPSLQVSKVARASAIQRAGRAGRLRPGRALRLYTRDDFEHRPFSDIPELCRADFAEPAMFLKTLGLRSTEDLELLDAPPASVCEASEALLYALGACSADRLLTDVGREMAKLPLHPRLGRLVVEGIRLGAIAQCVTIAAILSERDARIEHHGRLPTRVQRDADGGASDVLDALWRFTHAQRTSPQSAGLDGRTFRAVERARAQLSRLVPASGATGSEATLRRAILAAYPDRVAKRRARHASALTLCSGATGRLDPLSRVSEADLMVAVDAEVQAGVVVVRSATAIEPEWLLDLPLLQSKDAIAFDKRTERVERVRSLTYGSLVLEESRTPPADEEAAAAELLREARGEGIERFAGAARLVSWRARLEVAHARDPTAGFAASLTDGPIRALAQLVRGVRSFADLEVADWDSALQEALPHELAEGLRRLAPTHVALASGRTVSVNYSADREPWIASRIQDFFGLGNGPSSAGQPLTIELLAPNGRAVQVTRDLGGFWERAYPSVRKELMRKYPRHAWPEDPLSATPTVLHGNRSRRS